MKEEVIYIANDVEASGPRLGVDNVLSLGACVMSRERLTHQEYVERGLVFYSEIRPTNLNGFIPESMRVGCLHLDCLEALRVNYKKYDPTYISFDPRLVLIHMQRVCESAQEVAKNFRAWVRRVAKGRKVVGVTDTVFFDGGFINLLLASLDSPSPYGWTGLDLDSVYRGYAGRADASLSELGVVDRRIKPHRSDHDAVYLAQTGQVLLFEKMKW